MDNITPKAKTDTLLALDHGRRKISIDKEFIVDYKQNKLYYNKENTIIELSKELKERLIEEGIDEILGISIDGDDFIPIINNILKNEAWISSITKPNPTGVNTLSQLTYFLNNTDPFTVQELLDDLVDDEPGKTLSDNNFTKEERDKLKTITKGATNYSHPNTVQCKINSGVVRLNGYPVRGDIGNVNLTTKDIGLGDVDPMANNYTHPDETICNAKMIVSLNGKSGDVELVKSEFGLTDMLNLQLAHPTNFKDNEKYAVPAIVGNYLDKIEDERNSKASGIIPLNDRLILKENYVNTNFSHPEYIIYDTLEKTNKIINLFEFIDSYNYTKETNMLHIISDNTLAMYSISNGGLIVNDDGFDGLDFVKINMSNKLSVLQTQNKDMYGVNIYHMSTGYSVILWGKYGISDEVFVKQPIVKSVFMNDILYILLEDGTIKYKEYGKAVLNPRIREMMLSYNDIMDFYVHKDYSVIIRATRKITAAGTGGIVNRINSMTDSVFAYSFSNDVVAFINVRDNIIFYGSNINPEWSNLKLENPPMKIYINGSNLYIIDKTNKLLII